LNETVGGLNRAAVHVALQLGAKQVWMPARSAANNGDTKADLAASQSLIAPGRLLPEVVEIVNLVSDARYNLGTGHLSPEEVVVVAE
jgi:hypothetical protein